MKRDEITAADAATLRHMVWLREKFDAGLFARHAGQRSHIRRLTRLGLIEFEAMGRDIDGETERDVEIYKLTAAGIATAATPIEET